MRKRLYLILFLFTAVIATCTFVACGEEKRLASPDNVQITDSDYLTWSAVEGAGDYMVYINGKSYFTAENSLDLLDITTDYKTYKISVFALYDGNENRDSLPSQTLVYKPEYPADIFVYELSGKKDSGYSVSLKKDLPAESIPKKLIVPATTPRGESITAVNNLANDVSTCIWIPNSISSINSNAFAGSDKLTRVHLPQTLTALNGSTFYNCPSLGSIDLPSTLKTLYGTDFNGCKSLKEITIPASVTDLRLSQSGIFNGCENLRNIIVEEPATSEKQTEATDSSDTSDNGSDEKTDDKPKQKRFLEFKNGCLTLNETVLLKFIGNAIFPENVTTIYYYAFADNKEIVNLDLPYVEKIYGGAFSNCTNLESITLYEGLTILGDEINTMSFSQPVFMNCPKLKAIVIPSTVNNISGNLFSECNSLESVAVSAFSTQYESIDNFIIKIATNGVVCGLKATDFPSSVKKIHQYAYAYSSIERAVIPEGVTIEDYAFALSYRLKEVVLPESTTTIPGYAFRSCYNLETINIPAKLTSVGSFAFTGCSKLSLTLPKRVAILSNYALNGATVYTEAENENYWLTFGISQTDFFGGCVFFGCSFDTDANGEYLSSFTYATSDKGYCSLKKYPALWRDTTVCRAVPVRKGYLFEGWALSKNGDVVYKPFVYTPEDEKLSPYTVSLSEDEVAGLKEGTTLYAIWKAV